MADKQQILADVIPALVFSLANPPCVDRDGTPAPNQPSGPLDACDAGYLRTRQPVYDLHIGVVTSSLGGHGSDACNPAKQGAGNNDHGELVDRASGEVGAPKVPTYNGLGFLAWDPAQKLSPPGEASASGLAKSLHDLVIGVDQLGCGYESQLESWYRFLADPAPYDAISIQNNLAVPTGVDTKILEERSNFLRPDSLLAVVILSDENDCSTKEFSQFWISNQLENPNQPGKQFHLPGPRSECASDPNNPCCLSCGQDQGSCPVDPTCQAALPALDDDLNLRCYDQKRRFGINFLYPLDRYTQALSSPSIPNRNGELVANPIFAGGRDPTLVKLLTIVGVPWQDIARDPQDLSKGYRVRGELEGVWPVVIGEPATGVPPQDPLMLESVAPRHGTNPVTKTATSPPGTVDNPMNGSEYDIPNKNDLQYACIFKLPLPRDCTSATSDCDCGAMMQPTNSPLCMGTLQVAAKAYPGQRQLQLARALGDNAAIASICPAQVLDANRADYGYQPAIDALITSIGDQLQ
jgi:hypothetical protein